jgi:L-threonate 2-dehydrogenase
MTASNMTTAAIIGLGSMGLGMAQSIARAGITVAGFDLNSTAMSKLAETGSRAGFSAADAARGADVLVVVVVNAAQTDAVLFGPDGAAPAMKPRGVVVSCATMAPDEARRLAAKAQAMGLDYLDAPISGGAVKAAIGALTVMASGTPAAFTKARTVLNSMATTVHELGDEAGIGASFKMVNQLLAGVHIAAACEAITFAQRLGLDLPKVYKVITGSAGNSWMFENRIPHVLDGNYAPRSAVEIFTKDLGIVSDMGRSRQFPLHLTATALQMFLMTAAAGMGKDDDASVARMLAEITGQDLPANPKTS